MNLGKLWVWQKKKLPCRIRQESGNPAVDDLRERMAELAGIKRPSFLEEGKAKSPSWSSGGNCGNATPQCQPNLGKEVVRTLNSAKGILTSIDSLATPPSRNIHKKYLTAPKLLPSKLVYDVQRERLKLIMDSGNGGGPSKEEEDDDAEQDADSADEFLKDVKLRGKKKWKKCGKAKRDKEGPNVTTNNANEKAGHQLICAGCSSGIQGGHRAVLKTSSGSITATSTPITRTPDEEMSLVKSDMTGMTEHRRVSTSTGYSSGVSKTSYQGSIFGTGGNYVEGMMYSSRMPDRDKNSRSRRRQRIGDRRKRSAKNDGSDNSIQDLETQRKFTDQRVCTAAGGLSNVSKISCQRDSFCAGGKYLEGMTHMSRTSAGAKDGQSRYSERTGNRLKRSASTNGIDNLIQDLGTESGNTGESVWGEEDDPRSTSDQTSQQRGLEAKIRCASTLLAWSRHNNNAQRLAKEGAVEAILKLCKTDSLLVRGYCSAAMKRFAATPVLREKLIARGGVPIIDDMVSQCREEVIQTNCMVALANLTCINGQEAKIVEDGLVLTMVMIMNEQEGFDRLCATGLFNLTCVSEPYSNIEGVLKALLRISGSSSLEVKQTCASAFCNLADLPTIHSRIIKAGVISAIGSISRGASTKTRRICAIAFHSLAATKQERINMVSEGSIPILYGLSTDEDETTLHIVACTFVRLGTEEQCHGRMIHDGVISGLCNISMSSAGVPETSLPCAFALNTISKHADYQVTIADEGCIPAIVALLSSSEDVPTQYYALMVLCSVAMRKENHSSVLQQGTLPPVLALTRHTSQIVRDACALAIFNLSCGSAIQEKIVQAGSVPAIIALSVREGVDVTSQRRCVAALLNLARAPANIARMVEEGVISNIIHLLKIGDAQCIKYCCATLCLVAQDVHNCVPIINEGAIPHMLTGIKDGDITTKQACCAVLSTLSSQEVCREQLCYYGALPALIQVASMDDEATKLRCAVAFANLSCEYIIRGQMVKTGVVRVLSELSASYKEKNQLYCAITLCNLAYPYGYEMTLIEEGGFSVLMMIALVRSVSPEAKQVCTKALLNFVAEDTLPILIDEGIIAVVTNLSKLNDEESMRACATVLALLSTNAQGRAKIAERTSSLVSLFELLRSEDQGTQVICGKAVCNLVCCLESQLAAIKAGAIACLKQLVELGVPEVEAAVAMAFLLTAGNRRFRAEIKSTALPTVVCLSRSPHANVRCICVRTLGVLAWHDDSRAALSGVGVARALVDIIEDTAAEGGEGAKDQLAICTRALYFLAIDQSLAGYLIEAEIVRALSRVMDFEATESVLRLVAATLRCLTRVMAPSWKGEPSRKAPGVRELVAAQRAGSVVRQIVEAAGSPGNDVELQRATLYDCAVVIFNLAGAASECTVLQRDLVGEIGEGGMLPALATIARVRSTRALVMATLALLSNDLGNREEVVLQGGAELVVVLTRELDDWTGENEEVVTNALCALFLMSRAPPFARERLKEGRRVMQFLANLSKHGSDVQKKMASDAFGNLTQDVSTEIDEGTVAALISQSFDDLGDMDASDDLIQSSFVPPRITPLCIEQHGLGEWAFAEGISYEVQTVGFVKKAGGEGGNLPPPPEPPVIEGQELSTPPPPHDPKTGIGEEEKAGDPKIMQFAKMDVPEKYMTTKDEELVINMEQRKSGGRNFKEDSAMEGHETPEDLSSGATEEGASAPRTSGERNSNEDSTTERGVTPEEVSSGATGEGTRTPVHANSICFQGDKNPKFVKKYRVRRTTLKKRKSTSAINHGHARRDIVRAGVITAPGKPRDSREIGNRTLQRAWTRPNTRAAVFDEIEGNHGSGLALDLQAAALGLYV
ncbi:unnamed protein product [Ascophyllum nodosum]